MNTFKTTDGLVFTDEAQAKKHQEKISKPMPYTEWVQQKSKASWATVAELAEAYANYIKSFQPSAEEAIKAHTVTKDGFRGIPVGGTIYGFCNGTISGVVLKEGDILNRNYYWLTDLEYKCLCTVHSSL